MDYHSKNVYVIGVLYTVCCLAFLVAPLTRSIRVYFLNDSSPFLYFIERQEDEEPFGELSVLFALQAAFALLAILASVMVRGVIKKRHQLMTPFLAVNLLLCGALVVYIVFPTDHKYEKFASLYNLQEFCFITSMLTILMYPTVTLFLKIRSEAALVNLNRNLLLEYENKTDELLTKKMCL